MNQGLVQIATDLRNTWIRPEPPPAQEETGFFTDTTLCIGCKACEVACKQWNQLPADGFTWTGHSYDNTVTLSDTTWRHVAFVEQFDSATDSMRWLMMSDVCKHCHHAPCVEVCPTGALIYNEFGNVYVHVVLRPAERRAHPGVRQVVPHRVNQIWQGERAARARKKAR